MVPEQGRWLRGLFRVARWRASEAELGDVMEEYASGERNSLWLIREIFSAVRRPRTHETLHERRGKMLSNVWIDTRYALRTFRRNPGFAATAMVPIALGIGINTGIFAILSNVALRPLPTPDSTALVTVHQDFQGVKGRRVHGARSMFSIPEYETYRDTTKTLSGIMAYTMAWTFTLGGKAPQEIEGVLLRCPPGAAVDRHGIHSGELRRAERCAVCRPQPRALDARVRCGS